MNCYKRDEHNEYINGFFSGNLGAILKESNPNLFEECKNAYCCTIIRGEAEDDSTLDYMRNTIGFIKALTERGACGVLDLLTFSLLTSDEWEKRFFEKDINAQNHVVILLSKEQDEYWLHTRGMAEFGRPDISIKNVTESRLSDCQQIVNQMIFYGGKGAFFNGNVKIHISEEKSFLIKAELIDDFDNDDFNNAYCEVTLLAEE